MNLDDIASLSPDELGALKARLDGLTDTSGRSPLRPRQLHDLNLKPTAEDPRPTFFWSAEKPRNAGDLSKIHPYPRLMWHAETGEEITVVSASAQATRAASGYLLSPPFAVAIDPMAMLAAQLDALSEQDRALLIESQKQDRIAALRAQLVALPEEKLAALLAQSDRPAKAKRTA